MRLLDAEVFNFASYKHLKFNFDNLGLCLVQGATGSGKSTLMDIPHWVLYGKTAKGGSVDEVINWSCNEEHTLGIIRVELSSGDIIKVVRTRSNKSTQNDLFYTCESEVTRGKDISDTQTMLEQRLGLSSDLYGMIAQFNEFSDTANFFLAPAKDRRKVFDKIATLDLAINLGINSADERKKVKKALAEKVANKERRAGRYEQLMMTLADTRRRNSQFDSEKNRLIAEYAQKSQGFEKEKLEKIAYYKLLFDNFETSRIKTKEYFNRKLSGEESTVEICPECKSPISVETKEKYFRDSLEYTQEQENPIQNDLDRMYKAENIYIEKLKEEKCRSNPYSEQLIKLEADYSALEDQLEEDNKVITGMVSKIDALAHLCELSVELRTTLLKKAIKEIETTTNKYLDKYFDSEFKVIFSAEDADKLEVSIQKNGYDVVYTQLSKGQRQLLRICFVVSVMHAAANKYGIHVANIFIDEGLDGLDTTLKLKAFGLLQELEITHESVLVIDHAPELQSMFINKMTVSFVNGESQICQTQE